MLLTRRLVGDHSANAFQLAEYAVGVYGGLEDVACFEFCGWWEFGQRVEGAVGIEDAHATSLTSFSIRPTRISPESDFEGSVSRISARVTV